MCIDAPESTTNSLSSGFNVDAGRLLFSGDEKNVALSCSLNLNTFLASFHAASRAPCSCHSLFLKPILKFWSVGATLMRVTWANISERRIFVSNFSVTRNSLREFHTLDWFPQVCALPEKRLRRLHVLKYTTQLPCIRKSTFWWISSQFLITSFHKLPRSIVTSIWDGFPFMPISLFQHSHSTFVIIRFRPFRRLFINLTMCEWALLPKTATTLGLLEQAFWRVPLFTEWIVASSFEVILAGPSRHSSTETCLWDFWFCKTETLSTHVHKQVHHFDTRRLDQTLTTNHTKVWRSVPDAILPGHRKAHWWVPARTPTVHQCPQSGEAVGGQNASQEDSKHEVFRQAW